MSVLTTMLRASAARQTETRQFLLDAIQHYLDLYPQTRYFTKPLLTQSRSYDLLAIEKRNADKYPYSVEIYENTGDYAGDAGSVLLTELSSDDLATVAAYCGRQHDGIADLWLDSREAQLHAQVNPHDALRTWILDNAQYVTELADAAGHTPLTILEFAHGGTPAQIDLNESDMSDLRAEARRLGWVK
jgi:hypothetical protein